MKNRTMNFKKISIFTIGTFLLLGLFAVSLLRGANAAGSASFSLNPGTQSVEVNTNVTVTINVNSGSETINAVDVVLNYDPSKLEFQSISDSGSAFPVPATATGGGGNVQITRGAYSVMTGSQKVASVTFKALVGSGSTGITFGASSAITKYDSGTNTSSNIWNENPAGGTYSFSTPAPTSNPDGGSGGTGGTGGTGNTSGSGSGSTPSPTPEATPVDQAVVVSDPNSPAKKYMVAILVKNKKNEPVEGADVTLGDKTAKTDASGVASFTDVEPGTYETTVKGAFEAKKTVSIDGETDSSAVLQYEVVEESPKGFFTRSRILLFSLIGLGVLVAIAAVIAVLQKRRSGGSSLPPVQQSNTPPENPIHFNPNTPPSSVIMPENPEEKPPVS